MKRGALAPALLFAGVAPTFALSTDVPSASDSDEATTLPPIVVQPTPNPLGDPLKNLRRSLPDLGYQPRTKHSRLAEDLNEGTEFERQFYTTVLSGENPQLSGPPAPYMTEGDGTLAKRVEEEFRSAERADGKAR